MNKNPKKSISPDTTPDNIPSRFRIRAGLFMTLCGLLVFLVGARPAIFGLDRSQVVGFVQISVFLVGMAIICLGGYVSLMAYWRNGDRTIPADIGTRLVWFWHAVAAARPVLRTLAGNWGAGGGGGDCDRLFVIDPLPAFQENS
jgi:hypothetical protein